MNLNKLSVIGSAILMMFLASCSSSNQLASSFGKRKYMPGHFFDAVAKVKTKSVPGIATGFIPSRKAEKISSAIMAPVSFAVKSAREILFAAPKALLNVKTKLLNASHPSANTRQNDIVMAASPDNITTYHHGGESSATDKHYARSLIIWALIFLLSILIIAATISNNNGTITGVFLLVGLIAGIATLVYLVLLIGSLGSN